MLDMQDELRELRSVIHQLNKNEKRQLSLSWHFWRGIFYGFGFFVGSAILATIIVYSLSHLQINENTVIGNFFENVLRLFERAKT
ncbi:MAG: DUF5665 domain-containing protein [Candidatus Berkelbacteria bacterium]